MGFKKEKIVAAHTRLAGLYPAGFRRRFGEGMERTFRDLCNENQAQDGTLGAGFVLSAFADAFAGIARERFVATATDVMGNLLNRIAASAIFGFAATSPFVLMEWAYSGGFPQGVPWAIFGVLALEAALFAFLAISVSRTLRTTRGARRIVPVLLKTVAMVVIASSWTFIVADQMPCFLGGRGC